MLVFGTIFQLQGDLGGVVAGALQATGIQIPTQRQQITRWLGYIDIDRIQLLNGRQRLCLTIADQRALGHRGTADTPGNGG